jgi:hypothetical protein
LNDFIVTSFSGVRLSSPVLGGPTDAAEPDARF